MKKITVLLLFLMGSLLHAWTQVSFGDSHLFNDNWLFFSGDEPSASKPDYNDKNWRFLDLPHDWSIEGTLSPDLVSATGYLPGGIGWYRKAFDLEPTMKGQCVYLYFEGVYNYGEVFVNGHSLGVRPNGYVSYLVDLTRYLVSGRNVVAVKVDHTKFADSRWYTGSGIYRDVYLIVSDPVHISQWGVFFTTPVVEKNKAKATVRTSVTNTTSGAVTVKVDQQLLDANGSVVAKASGKVLVGPADSAGLDQQLTIASPIRWTLEQPALYTLKTSLSLQGKVIDRSEQKVGIRTLRFDPNTGFYLNDINTKVKGVCLHHDAGCLGAAVPEEVWRERLQALKKMGCNAIRTSHNPQAPVVYTLCDELGLLVMNEAFDEWEFPKKKWVKGWNQGTPVFEGSYAFFEKWGETDLRDMILRDRNHPSVMMWSIGNEVDYPNDPYSHPVLNKEGIKQQHTQGYLPNQPAAERLGGIAKRLAAVVRANDPTRPVTAGLAGPVMSNETDYPASLDVVGYNYTENRYAQDHAKYPNRVFYGSETSRDLASWLAVADNPYIFGQFLWTGADYLGEAHAWPSRGFSSGMFDLAGFQKPTGYFRESLWSSTPMIYIGTMVQRGQNPQPSIEAPARWNYKEGQMIQVCCYTNCEQARLNLDGQSVGEIKKRDPKVGIITWTIPYKPGKLEAVGINGDRVQAVCALETSDRPAAIQATVSKTVVSSKRGVAIVTIRIVDEKGIAVFDADNEITCRVQGPARLLGMESGNMADMGDYRDARQRVYQGRLKAYVQATGKPGKVTLQFSSPWLKDASVEVNME